MAGVLKAKVGGVWVPVVGSGMSAETARWNSAWGVVGVGSFTFADAASFTDGTALTLPLAVTLVAGRRYRVTMIIRAVGYSANVGVWCTLTMDGAPVQQAPFTQIIGNTNFTQMHGHWMVTGATSGPHSFVVGYVGTTGVVGYSGGSNYYIEDVGPTTYVAAPPPLQTPGPWTPLGLLNGWAHSGLPRPVPSYRLTGDVVELRLSVRNGAPNTPLAALPVGARPPYILDVYGRDNAGPGVFNINPDGGIVWYGAAGNNGLVALSMSFSTTA